MSRPGARHLALLLMALMVVACGADETTANRAAGTFRPARPGVLRVATAQVPAPGFWQGTVANPTGGFEWGLAKAFASRFGLALVEIVEVPFEDLISGRLAGADMALSQLTFSEGRDRVLDFSTPYLPGKPAILTRAGARVNDMETAQAQRWSVRRRSTLERFLNDKVRPTRPVQAVDTRQESLDALTNGNVDAVLLDLPVATAIASTSGGRLEVAAQFPSDDNLAAALPDHSSNKDAVDSAVRALATDGTLRTLADRWLHVALTGGLAEDIPVIQPPS
ncbi:MAG TPA: ABC transporter substrate-binding protein [Acidimicrobiales bacterium]|nr:ABC transporter substrate-binding protein [Acidimicrobiales bacterium]